MKNLLYTFLFAFIFYSTITLPKIITVGAPGTAGNGKDPDITSLEELVNSLNNRVWEEGPIYLESYKITSDMTVPAGLVLTASGLPNDGSIGLLFYGDPDNKPVITFTTNPDDTSQTQIGWTIASVETDIKNITFQSDSSCSTNIIPIKIEGPYRMGIWMDSCNVFYKSKTAGAGPEMLACALYLAGSYSFVSNSVISSDFPGVSAYSIGIYEAVGSVCFINNNVIMAKYVGIWWLPAVWDSGCNNNTITINQDIAAIQTFGFYAPYGGGIGSSKIYMSKNNYSKNSGATGIYGYGSNNFITGFYLCNNYKTDSSYLTGIEGSGDNNTIVMNDLLVDSGWTNPVYAGIKSDWFFVRNNIIVNEENDIPAYCLFAPDTIITSDFNNLYLPGASAYTGSFKNIQAKTLQDWQMLTAQDTHSVSIEVFFISAADLHLTGSSVGDTRLAGIPIDYIDTDIDGETRNTLYPYMGADEASVPLTMRVISSVADNALPKSFELMQNYPNPFNPVTKIVYNLPNDSHVKIEIISVTGEVVTVLADEYKTAGSYTNYFTANNLASGTYIYRLTAGDNVVSKKMMLLK